MGPQRILLENNEIVRKCSAILQWLGEAKAWPTHHCVQADYFLAGEPE